MELWTVLQDDDKEPSMKTGMCLATENEGRFLICQFQVQGALMAQQLLTEGVPSLIGVMPKTRAGFILFIIHVMEEFFLTV